MGKSGDKSGSHSDWESVDKWEGELGSHSDWESVDKWEDQWGKGSSLELGSHLDWESVGKSGSQRDHLMAPL